MKGATSWLQLAAKHSSKVQRRTSGSPIRGSSIVVWRGFDCPEMRRAVALIKTRRIDPRVLFMRGDWCALSPVTSDACSSIVACSSME